MRPLSFQLATILLFSVLFVSKSECQSFRRFSIEDGLPVGSIIDIEQDKTGFLWLGSTSGLVRYDSHRGKYYKHVPKDSLSIPSNYVRDIVTDGANNLWLITRGNVSYFDSQTERFQNLSLKDFSTTLSQSFDAISLFRDSENRIWMSTTSGVFEIRRRNNIVTFSENILKRIRAEGFRARNLSEDHSGVLWVSTDEGLIRINKDGSQAKRVFGNFLCLFWKTVQ